MTAKNPTPYAVKNLLFAFGMLLFLAISFKLAGGLTDDPAQDGTLSASDTVLSSLQTPTADKPTP